MYKRIVIVLCIFFAQILSIEAAIGGTTTIAVASNFLIPAKELAKEFEKQTGHKVRISAGSTGKLYAQIINGAPFDAFFAANEREPKRLEDESLIVPGSRFTYALGQLVLWSPVDDKYSEYSLEEFERAQFKSLAIANPRTAPYGRAAFELVKKYHGARPSFRIVRGENVGQAYQYVKSGNINIGFVALSQVLADKSHGGSFWKIPDHEYTPIRQQAVLLNAGSRNPVTSSFMRFMTSDLVKQKLSKLYGYKTETTSLAATIGIH